MSFMCIVHVADIMVTRVDITRDIRLSFDTGCGLQSSYHETAT